MKMTIILKILKKLEAPLNPLIRPLTKKLKFD